MKKLILTLVLGVFFIAFSNAQSPASTKKAVKNETYTVQQTKKAAVSTPQSCKGKAKAACKGKAKACCAGKNTAKSCAGKKACCAGKNNAKSCAGKKVSCAGNAASCAGKAASCKGKATKSCGSGKS